MDVLTGAVSYLAQAQGTAKASHVKDKVTEMIHLSETLYCSSVACSAEGFPTESGAYMVDTMLANVCKHNVTRHPYEIARIAQLPLGTVKNRIFRAREMLRVDLADVLDLET